LAGGLTKILGPRCTVAPVGPERELDSIEFAPCGSTIIEHRAQQRLYCRLNAATIQDAKRETGGQTAPSALSGHGNPRGVDAKIAPNFAATATPRSNRRLLWDTCEQAPADI
jgi:hypothetical protein